MRLKSEIMIHEIQHVPLKFMQEEMRKLEQKDAHYAKLIMNMKLRNMISKGDYSLDPHGIL